MEMKYQISLMGHYRGADKSLARPWKKTSYSNHDLQHYTKTYGERHKSWYSVVNLGRCSLFPFRVGLRTYQYPGMYVHMHACTFSLSLSHTHTHTNTNVVRAITHRQAEQDRQRTYNRTLKHIHAITVGVEKQ